MAAQVSRAWSGYRGEEPLGEGGRVTGGRGPGRSVRGKWMGAKEEKGGRAESARAEGARARSGERRVYFWDSVQGVGGQEVRGGTWQTEAGFGGVTEKWAEVSCGGEWKMQGWQRGVRKE